MVYLGDKLMGDKFGEKFIDTELSDFHIVIQSTC